jgi:hypothetical protein
MKNSYTQVSRINISFHFLSLEPIASFEAMGNNFNIMKGGIFE